MTVEFYFSQEVNSLNERRALYRVAHLLQRRYGRSQTEHLVLVANIPELEPGLTQLDVVLFGQKFVAVLDFKNYPDPIDGLDPDKPWYVRGTRQRVGGGKSQNPYKQAKKARYVWSDYLARQAGCLLGQARSRQLAAAWGHLNVWVLFHPYLHPDSKIMHSGRDHLWLNFDSVDNVTGLVFAAVSDLRLQPAEVNRLVRYGLAARPWHELGRLLRGAIGYLYLFDPDGSRVAYPVGSYETLTIGRSRHQHIKIDNHYTAVSSHHATIEAQSQAVRLYDAGSTNHTYINGRQVDSTGGVLLRAGDVISLAGVDGRSVCYLRFESHPPAPEVPLGETTTLVTEQPD